MFRPFQAPPGFEHAGDGPGLRRATAWGMRRVAVEDLADLTEAGIGQMVADGLQKPLCRRGVAVDSIMRERPGTKQPSPDGALVVGAIAFGHRAGTGAAIGRLVGR